MDLSALRPRFAADLVFLPSRSGASFHSHGAMFDIDEPGTYELVRRMARDLDGTASLAEIIERHEPDVRPAIVRLVDRLRDRGVVRDTPVHTKRLPDAVRTRFAAPLELLDHLSDDAEERFESFRTSRVLMLGSGTAFAHCAAALLRNGLEQLWVVERDDDGSVRDPMRDRATIEAEAEAEHLRRDGLSADVQTISAADLASRRLEPFSLVLYVADSPSFDVLSCVGREALKHGGALLPGVLLEPHRILFGPLMQMPACYVCTFRRTLNDVCNRSQIQGLFRRDVEPPSHAAGAAEALARRLGGDVAFEAFKALAGGVRPELTRGVILQTATGPASVRAVFIPCMRHSCWGGCRRFVRYV